MKEPNSNSAEMSEMKQQSEKYAFLYQLRNIVGNSLDQSEIFHSFLSLIVPYIDGESGLIIWHAHNSTQMYYGLNQDGEKFCGESSEAESFPSWVLVMKALADKVLSQHEHPLCVIEPDLLCVSFVKKEKEFGYLCVRCRDKQTLSCLDSHGDFKLFLQSVLSEIILLIEQKNALKQALLDEKEQFFEAIVSKVFHDIRNPLSGISGFVQLIKSKSDDKSVNSYCDTIMNSLSRIEEINSDYSLVTKKNVPDLSLSKIKLVDIVDDVVDKYAEIYKYENIAVKKQYSCDEMWVNVDKKKMVKVLYNIFDNARDAIDPGGEISVSLYKEAESGCIKISDNGKGIPLFIQECIFKPFTTYGKKARLGLGMSVAKLIVTEHKGTLSVESSRGKGTSFTIVLPVLSGGGD